VPDLTDQPTPKPTRKVLGGSVAGSVAVIVLVAASAAGLDVPGLDLDGLDVGAALGVVVTAAGAYLTRSRTSGPDG
jgi:hypothetical protein